MFYLILLILIIAGIFYAMPGMKNKSREEREAVVVTEAILDKHIAFFRRLTKEKKIQFKNEIQEFLGSVKITGVDTSVTEIDKVLVAASAVIPVFSFPEWKYHNLEEVLLYSDTINIDFQTEGADRNIMGMVGSGYMEGKMLLSKPALELGFKNTTDKNNTAIHEFVHLIDKADGDTDGVPGALMDKQYCLPWLDMIHQEMEQIKKGRSDINPYGYTNKSEFFAVASEYFFERPDLLQQKHPELYELLQQVFRKTVAS